MSDPKMDCEMLEGRFWAQWSEMICPYCDAHCFVNGGDPDDFCGLMRNLLDATHAAGYFSCQVEPRRI